MHSHASRNAPPIEVPFSSSEYNSAMAAVLLQQDTQNDREVMDRAGVYWLWRIEEISARKPEIQRQYASACAKVRIAEGMSSCGRGR